MIEAKKIKIEKSPKTLDINIDQSIDAKQVKIIGIWLALWTLCGVIILASLFLPNPKETKMMMIVFLTFWAYFESSVYNAYKWKKAGKETLNLKEGKIEIKVIGGKEKSYSIQVDKIKEIIVAPESKFRSAMNSSFWNIGEPAVFIKTAERSIGFGRQLNREDAIKIEKLLKSSIK